MRWKIPTQNKRSGRAQQHRLCNARSDGRVGILFLVLGVRVGGRCMMRAGAGLAVEGRVRLGRVRRAVRAIETLADLRVLRGLVRRNRGATAKLTDIRIVDGSNLARGLTGERATFSCRRAGNRGRDGRILWVGVVAGAGRLVTVRVDRGVLEMLVAALLRAVLRVLVELAVVSIVVAEIAILVVCAVCAIAIVASTSAIAIAVAVVASMTVAAVVVRRHGRWATVAVSAVEVVYIADVTVDHGRRARAAALCHRPVLPRPIWNSNAIAYKRVVVKDIAEGLVLATLVDAAHEEHDDCNKSGEAKHTDSGVTNVFADAAAVACVRKAGAGARGRRATEPVGNLVGGGGCVCRDRVRADGRADGLGLRGSLAFKNMQNRH